MSREGGGEIFTCGPRGRDPQEEARSYAAGGREVGPACGGVCASQGPSELQTHMPFDPATRFLESPLHACYVCKPGLSCICY